MLARVLKNIMDYTGAAVILILLSPLFLFLFWKIKKDGGPAFFGHVRIGRNGRPFKCWKFRTMVPNAQAVLKELFEKDPAAQAEYEENFKLQNDPRITKVGHFLRKTSLDEIPQFINVLFGEMSLVGPRPVVDAEKKYYGDKFKYYTSVKPGITGLWQVSGRSDTGYEKRVALDVDYVENWSLGRDIYILLKTVQVVLARKGAY
jgi:Undecaprenyl-phosphate galactose phosphotransferase WbaP